MSHRLWLACASLPFFAACASTGKTAALTGHYSMGVDYEVDGGALEDDDADLDGLGGEAHFLSLGPDLSVGYERRELEDEDADEYFASARFFLIDSPIVSPYLTARVRTSDGFDIGNSDSYVGYGVGGGAFLWLGSHVVIDAQARWEGLFEKPDIAATEVDFEGVVVALGIGVAF